jgi:two-component system sensor histidine kinase QseC
MNTTVPSGQSLQARLLGTVLGLVCVVWLVTVAATWMDTEHEVGELLDAHLSQAASLLASLPVDELTHIRLPETPTLHEYQPKVVLQVWHADQMLIRSGTAPLQPLAGATQTGFTKTVIHGESWRVFSAAGLDEHVVIHVAEQDTARYDVILASLRSVIWPMTAALPFLALGVWWAVRHAVKPLRDLGLQVAHRRPGRADPLPLAQVPREAQPLVTELNRLFERMANLLESERRFTADAAHELRTPIAGIRMQAQVAQGAETPTERNEALAATLQGCDRATRLVEQLLQLARLEAEADVTPAHTPLEACLQGVVADLTPVAAQRQQHIELHASEHAGTRGPMSSPAPEALTAVLARNLLDNALRYSPPGATVRAETHATTTGQTTLTVEDSGPGLSNDQLQRLGERFFRVLGSGQPGSGLGWSIVTRITRLYGMTVTADRSPALGGLRVRIAWRTLPSDLRKGPSA